MPATRPWPIHWVVSAGVACGLGLGLVLGHAGVEAGRQPPPVTVSVARGYCDRPFSLRLTAPGDGAFLRYTVDGTEPAWTNGTAYSTPLMISNTTLMRVAAFRDRARASSVTTHSYLFLDQILLQPKAPPGFPAGPAAWNGLPSAYQMDARVVNDPVYRDRMRDAFKSMPVVSITCAREDLFGPRGLYLNTLQRGEGSRGKP